MRESTLIESQVVSALEQAETGILVKEVIRRTGITKETLYRWIRKYGDSGSHERQQFEQLQQENRKLKQMVADLDHGATGGPFKGVLKPRRKPGKLYLPS